MLPSGSVLKTIATHVGSIFGGAMLMFTVMSSHAVDVYAIWAQLQVIYQEILKLVAIATPLATMIYGAWRSTATNRVTEISNDPAALQAVEKLPPTPKTIALAEALKK